MPRQPRLDRPGLLQHVIARGVDRQTIFRDDKDRRSFLDRLSSLLMETETECFAWALIPNHFHLLLRPNRTFLASVMRRLQTGYAVCFNLRHHRSGHLFQNRYKSIVCEEEVYLLELVRYIHLNPLRAGLVREFSELDRFRWCGHAVLMGEREWAGQAVEEVLGRFGRTAGEARQRYRAFVEAGVRLGRREELTGGGLRRSLTAHGRPRERIDHDTRVLGSGDFVAELRRDQRLRERLGPATSLDDLVERVRVHYGLAEGELEQRSRRPDVVEARAVACYLGVRELRFRNVDVGKRLGMTSGGVSMAVRRAVRIRNEKTDLASLLGDSNSVRNVPQWGGKETVRG